MDGRGSIHVLGGVIMWGCYKVVKGYVPMSLKVVIMWLKVVS